MKVAIECHSPLLQRSLELFLVKEIRTYKQCDVVITDTEKEFDKPYIFVSQLEEADLIKPFSKAQLLLAINKAISSKKEISAIKEMVEQVELEKGSESETIEVTTTPLNFEILEKRIELLTQEYQENILKTVRAFYEK